MRVTVVESPFLASTSRGIRQLELLSWCSCYLMPDICIDYDMFVQGQDFELTDLNVEDVSGSADKATVKATFKNFGEAKEVTFDLIRDDKGWTIDQMTSGCQSLSNLYRHDYCD